MADRLNAELFSTIPASDCLLPDTLAAEGTKFHQPALHRSRLKQFLIVGQQQHPDQGEYTHKKSGHIPPRNTSSLLARDNPAVNGAKDKP